MWASLDEQVSVLWSRVVDLKYRYFPGICVSITIAVAASFLAQRYGAPAMLMALLLGLAFNFLGEESKCLPGIEYSTSFILRLGVALLGLRITFADVFPWDGLLYCWHIGRSDFDG